MSDEKYVELYKKYRPKVWEDLIGQDRVAKSLRSAVVQNKIPTAYGFFGSRGTGKSSSAFLLAKAINCLNPTKTGNPCNSCSVCQNIDNRTQIGVSYESMANGYSADAIRDLVSKAHLHQPIKKQVFILDEVHNLSKQAFDALLIPIESDTMPSLFILCSTEVDKIPDTILSRIQQRRLTLVNHDNMKKLLDKIVAEEHYDVTDNDVEEAIRQGRGSVRDTLSAFETIILNDDNTPLFGQQLLEDLATKDLKRVFSTVAVAVNDGFDGRDLAEQLFSDVRDVLLLGSNSGNGIVETSPVQDAQQVYKKLLGERGIFIVEEELGKAITEMHYGSDSKIQLEISLVKIITKLRKLQKVLQNR